MKTLTHRNPGTCSLASALTAEQRKKLNEVAKKNKTA